MANPGSPTLTASSTDNRIDIVFLGDGYTAAEIDTSYTHDVSGLLSYLFDDTRMTEPFGRYENFFNIIRIPVVSNQSGASNSPTDHNVDTALGAHYNEAGIERLLVVDFAKTEAELNSALSGSGVTPDIIFVTVNSAKYGGSGGVYAVYAGGNPSAYEIALHEVGHSFAHLADEYSESLGQYTGPEPNQPNVTTDPGGARWAEWLGYDDPYGSGLDIGAYEGGSRFDTGIYHPSANSKMNALGVPFDAVSREAFIHAYYADVDPIDSYTPNTAPVSVHGLTVDVIDPAVIDVDWTVDGTLFADAGEEFDLATHGFGVGTHSVTARAYDPTDWVRGDRSDLEESVSWTVISDIESATVGIAAENAIKQEGNTGGTSFTFTVTRSGDLTAAASIDWTVTGSGANPADAADFANAALPSNTINFNPGDATRVITVNVAGDTVVEPDEGFTVTLSNPVGASISTASAIGTIQNDDQPPTLSIAATNAGRLEGNSGTTPFTFTVTRSGDFAAAATANWTVTGSVAWPASAADFANAALPSGTINFAAGDATPRVITVNVAGDTVVEASEGFTVTLSNASGATISTASANGTILNDDALFDANFYLARNTDVKAAGADPLLHFELYGWKEGREPSLVFSDSKYLAAYPDVKAAGVDPLLHYMLYGQNEGRTAFLSGGTAVADPLIRASFYDPQLGYDSMHPATLIPTGPAAEQQAAWSYETSGWQKGLNPDAFFDTNFYLTQNPDVKASGFDPLLHYELHGWKEGRDPSLLFSDRKYLAVYSDVKSAGFNPLSHYVLYGQSEGRMAFLTGGGNPADPLIRASYYDPQLGATLIPTGPAAEQQAAWSYETSGWQKSLNPDALFDTKYYLSHNLDVKAAGVDPLLHYELYGWKEGRDPSAQFSTNKYLATYSDVKAAGVDPLLHYLEFGQSEGRTAFPA